MTSATLRFTMLSDWHIGSGEGQHGSVDRTVLRGEDQLPFIPASTVKGILRDAAERVAFALDDGAEGGAWAAYAECLFGDEPALPGRDPARRFERPRPGLISFESARFSAALRQALAAAPLRDAVTFVKPGVEIDGETGTAKEDHLRLEEVCRRGAVLEARVDILIAEGHDEVVLAYLAAACRVIEAVGGKRRRGAGQCRVELFKGQDTLITGQHAAAALAAHTTPPTLTANKEGAQVHGGFADTGTADEFMRLNFNIHLEAPVIAGGAVEANIVTGLHYIPGMLLLPLIARELRQKPGVDAAAIDRAIANGDIRVLPAYPMIENGRSLPLPLGWQVEKGAEGKSRQLYRRLPQLIDSNPVANSQLKDLRHGFVCRSDENTHHLDAPRISVQTHNAIDDRVQRPSADVIGVFVYEGLSAGQQFASQVWIRNGSGFERLLSGARIQNRQIGKGRGRGYGRVSLSGFTTQEDGEAPGMKKQGDYLFVWFESDAILIGQDLQPVTSLAGIIDAIEQELGKAGAGVFDRGMSRSFIRTTVIDGWVSAWGMPRMGLAAVQAGSTLALMLNADLYPESLKRLQTNGIGIRRAEGFGVISLDSPVVKDTRVLHLSGSPPLPSTGPQRMKDYDSTFLSHVREAAWLTWIEKSAETIAAESPIREFDVAGAAARHLRGALDLFPVRGDVPLAAREDGGPRSGVARMYDTIIDRRGRVFEDLDRAGLPRPLNGEPPESLRTTALRVLALTHVQLVHREAARAAREGG